MKTGLQMVVFGLVLCIFTVVFAQVPQGQRTAGQMNPLQTAPLRSNAIIGQGGGDYTLGKDDIVHIDVRNQPEFTGDFIVGPNGYIQYKFVGDIKAEGLTKEMLKKAIQNKLAKYVKVPEISVAIAAYRSKFVYILGEVGSPGKYPMAGDAVSLRDAVFAAGVPPYSAALRRTWVIKPDTKNPTSQKVDLYKLLYQGVLKDNVVLSPGDIVVVPTTVPSEINRALSTLLAPFSNAAGTAATVEGFND